VIIQEDNNGTLAEGRGIFWTGLTRLTGLGEGRGNDGISLGREKAGDELATKERRETKMVSHAGGCFRASF
jgi:hypothetical protein